MGINIDPKIKDYLKKIDRWDFDIFEFDRITDGNSLKYIFYELLRKYDLLRKFKIPVMTLFNYGDRLQQGYNKHNNLYHNHIHAADVAQTLNSLLVHSGFLQWLTDVEIFSIIMAAVVHDLEHTGTTNNFHINTRSHLSQLYNDKSILENHHISSAFRLLTDYEDSNILINFDKVDYAECRALMVGMVLATDMSQHFSQLKQMKSSLKHPELNPENIQHPLRLEKPRALCMMIHSADINHPAKPWYLHYNWVEKLLKEFFIQGDRERELGLAISPLCDRHTTNVAQSQIGFIDYVIQPTFDVLLELFNEINKLGTDSGTKSPDRKASESEESNNDHDILKRKFSASNLKSLAMKTHENQIKLDSLKKDVFTCFQSNRTEWKRRDVIEQKHNLLGEEAFAGPEAAVCTDDVNNEDDDNKESVVVNGDQENEGASSDSTEQQNENNSNDNKQDEPT